MDMPHPLALIHLHKPKNHFLAFCGLRPRFPKTDTKDSAKEVLDILLPLHDLQREGSDRLLNGRRRRWGGFLSVSIQ